jgi:DNA polymerase I-like protein with 3'-5' exonuclease and polymerase domains
VWKGILMIFHLDKNKNLTESSIEAVCEFINNHDKLAYDVETTGLNTRKDRIIGFGVSNHEEGYYLCHLNFEEGELVEKLAFSSCVAVLERLVGKKLVMWNGSFDSRFSLNFFGVDLISSLWSEGMLAKHTCDEDFPFKLKDVAKKLYGGDAAEEQKLMKESIKVNGGSVKEYYKADLLLMAKYCIMDCILTYRINEKYLIDLEKNSLWNFYFKDEVMPLYREVTIPMELRGVPIDVQGFQDLNTRISIDIDKLHSEIQNSLKDKLGVFRKWFLYKDYPPKNTGAFGQKVAMYYDLNLPKTTSGKFSFGKKHLEGLEDSIAKEFLIGGGFLPNEDIEIIQELMWMDETDGKESMFNLNSIYHKKKLFFDTLEEEPLSRTPTLQPQCDDKFLDKMSEKYKWAELWRQYNKLSKLKGTYIERFLDNHEDGIFYPSFFQHRTVSGRYGSDLQQLPRPKEEGELAPLVLGYNNMIRKFFIAGDGCKFIDADYESLEPHVFAHVSGDENLKNIFRNGDDFYSTIAIGAENIKGVSANKAADNYLGKVNKPVRQNAKAYSLGVPYGLEEYALHMTLKCSKKEAANIIKNYRESFPELSKWMDSSNAKVVKDGFIRIESGRIRRFPSAPSIWFAHKNYILDSLKLYSMFSDNPSKYKQMKFLRKKMKNMLDNGKNVQIQGLGASIINRACIAISRELKRIGSDAYICCLVHDQVIVKCSEKESKRLQKAVQYIMENTYKISVPLKAPAEIANNFSDGH